MENKIIDELSINCYGKEFVNEKLLLINNNFSEESSSGS
jgi:hypothetical protein